MMYLRSLKPGLRFRCLLSLVIWLAGCAGQPEKTVNNANLVKSPSQTPAQPAPASQTGNAGGTYSAAKVSGDYAAYPAMNQFIQQMVQKHGFSREYLNGLFSQAKRKQWTLDYLAKSDQSLNSKPSVGGWTRYRSQFVDARHINGGVAFWQKHQAALQRASRQFGVPPEYILGIMGVETTFGGYVGNHRVLDALTTLGFDYQRRGEYFRGELENYLLMSRSEGIDPAKPIGSFAGAMGLGQFMPSSFLQWAVDFDGDGRRDLWQPEDAIGSVANYFAQHGWQTGQPVLSPAHAKDSGKLSLEPGLDHEYTLSELMQAGIKPVGATHVDYPLRLLWLRHANNEEYLLGHPNFYVITRYNHSTYYAMAVHDLAQAIRKEYGKAAGNQQTG